MAYADGDFPMVLGEIARARVAGDERKAMRLMRKIRFQPPVPSHEKPTRAVKASVYARDHYHCRYCGRKVILTPVMRLLSRLYPEDFPYHSSWRVDSTHPAFTSSSATLDHVVPISHGGESVEPDNLATACWACNRRKGDLSLDELGWSLIDPEDPSWTGLADLFEPLWEAAGRPELGTAEMVVEACPQAHRAGMTSSGLNAPGHLR
jgi:5-methylcytosine-specific restriction endonuclease McrA